MDVHALGWIGLAAIVLVLITIDIVGHVRSPHIPSMKESVWWTVGYIVLALVFGLVIWAVYGATYAGEYYAGYITEKSLSLDNLFVFIIIMETFRVPRQYQQKALLSGIIIALVLRLVFILVGAALIERFSWIFFLFGAWLLWTAWSQARQGLQEPLSEAEEYRETRFVRIVRRIFPVTDGFVSDRFLHRHGGKTYLTPLLLVVVALGSADLMFAFDSIPAIFGLTSEPYLVFAANAFSLLGLRQLYFVIDGLLEKLVYLHYGLAAILGFIGVKLILHALHDNSLPFINGGRGLEGVPDIGIPLSLGFIGATLAITVVASVLRSRHVAGRGDGPVSGTAHEGDL
ncbi:TerC family protein [Actinomyces polynesiensis]|uniref:TerC family protein n=1 Tax=Actinomyces polynesiensis TaxID=1325934 RepID=UPI0005BDF4AE|nr:TerC family protein [Actinomyces polynesiensis]